MDKLGNAACVVVGTPGETPVAQNSVQLASTAWHWGHQPPQHACPLVVTWCSNAEQ